MTDIEALLERFRRGAELVAATASGITGSEADFSPTPGKWPARHIIAHLADMELVAAHRFRRVIVEDSPSFPLFDGDRWAEALDYGECRVQDRLELLRAVRIANFELLRGLAETVFVRTAQHAKRGEVTLLDLLRLFTEHTEHHARQIEELREQYREIRCRS